MEAGAATQTTETLSVTGVMNNAEARASGLHKLTESERAYLDRWILDLLGRAMRGPGSSMRSSGSCESGNWIESVSDDGDIIKLSDGSVWEVIGGD